AIMQFQAINARGIFYSPWSRFFSRRTLAVLWGPLIFSALALVGETSRAQAAPDPTSQAATAASKNRQAQYVNGDEVHDEIVFRHQDRVLQFFPSFYEMYEWSQYHPRWGYYTSGKLHIGSKEKTDFSTLSQLGSPAFGQVMAEHAFKLWKAALAAGKV